MKKTYLIFAAAMMLASCAGSNQGASTQNSQPKESAQSSQQTEKAVSVDEINQKITELVRHIPDHSFKEEDEKYFTPEFRAMLKEAFSLPPLVTDGIDEASEFLFYFIEGNGDCKAFIDAQGDVEKALSLHKCENFKTDISGDNVVSQFDYVHGPEEVDHVSIVLKKSGSNYLIDDWNDNKKAVREYLEYYKNQKK